jgi:uncharacterized protein (DUF58 family)
LDPSALIPPDVRARLRALRLTARGAAAAHGLGQHSSRSRGVGLEFAQYRAYEPGDEPRRVDWKLYARSDRFFVRESERDSPLNAWIVIDSTASMRQADGERTKFDAARAIAACVIELALRQGDRFGLVGIAGHGLDLVPADGGPRHRDRCLQSLVRWAPEGRMPDEAHLRPIWERVAAGSLALVVTDGFDDALVALAERLAAARREVVFVQVLTAEERDFPFDGNHRFVDPETGDERRVDAAAARRDYLERFAAAQRVLTDRLAAAGIRYARHVLDEPVDAPLARLYGARGAEAAA